MEFSKRIRYRVLSSEKLWFKMCDNECSAQEATQTTPLQQPYTADFKLQVIKWAKTHRDSKNRLDVLGASAEFGVSQKDVKLWLSEAKRLRKGR